MPADTIDRAIKKGTGESTGEHFEEVVYEGYGAGGTAVLCDILTDNRNRTAGEVRRIFEVNGGNLGSTGCVAWMFERKALFTIPAKHVDEDRLFEVALEAGAEDVKLSGELYEVISAVETFQQVSDALEEAKIPTDTAELSRIPSTTVELDAAAGRKILKLLDALEDQDDVQSVTANFNIPDEVMADVAREL
jgi:YebC/PmpR family DNA-binding regulatory protein